MISSYLTDSVGLKTVTRDAVYHEPTYATVQVLARVEWKSKLVRSIKGEEVVASALVYLPLAVTPTHEDRIVIDGVDHVIISLEKKGDFTASHWEVWIGRE